MVKLMGSCGLVWQVYGGQYSHQKFSYGEEPGSDLSFKANVSLCNDMGRVFMGDRWGETQSQLQLPAIRRHIHKLHHRRLLSNIEGVLFTGQFFGLSFASQAQRVPASSSRVRAKELHGLRLLPRF
jgi:hypothetical protein